MNHFLDEYEAHIKEKRCPAKVCRALIKYQIVEGACTGCTVCARNCPVAAITGERKQLHVIDQDLCIKCGSCYGACPRSFFNLDVITEFEDISEIIAGALK